ncbi:G-type lectin S-receptor-like serine/threonine-protein kinase LECRK4, partial [Tanacetum coccineum]
MEDKGVVTERKRLISIISITLGFLALVCTLMAFFSFFFYRVHARRYTNISGNVDCEFIIDHFTLRSFSFNELQKVTDGFKEMIGKTSTGEVYKGFISNGKKAVAVKRLEKVFEGGGFRAEITAIAQTHHRNLVRLLGFCIHGATKLLIYEFMGNGSLADLYNSKSQIGWTECLRVALDVARGILYLHEERYTRIIHCNITPHNILFNESWTAKISDFGLSKPLRPNQSGTLTDISCCTSDMEIDMSSDDKIPLCTWVYHYFVTKELNRLIGDKDVDATACEKMVKVGLLCVQDDLEARLKGKA